MILRMSFEEVTALNAATERLLSSPDGGGVAAPPEVLAELEAHLPVRGDISILTLAQQRRLGRGLDFLLEHLKRRMDALIVELYVGADDTINAYFDYANVLSMRSRLDPIEREMVALIELMTGSPPTAETAEQVAFPD
jgi:hypothetical protein